MFLEQVRERHFAKDDFYKMAEKVAKSKHGKIAKTKYEWMLVIRDVYPDLTTEEMKLLYSAIKMKERM
jgi:hypothetical protein